MSSYNIGWITGTVASIAVFAIHSNWVGFAVCLGINIIGGAAERAKRA